MSFTALQNGQAENRIVGARFAVSHRGFFLAREGSLADPTWWALYNDGYSEEIDPAAGLPRPDPDPAVRTENAAIPEAMRGTPSPKHVTGSLFSGQMRRFVQCQFSNGVDNQFAYQWVTTQGLFEYPPKIIGNNSPAEEVLAEARTYYIIEISAHGIFAAPVKMPSTDLLCPDITDYMPTAAQRKENPGLSHILSLGWAFNNRNEGGRVQQIATEATMSAVYALGSPFYLDHGWAFNYSGSVASNVIAKSSTDGVDTDVVNDFYQTTLVDIEFSATSAAAKDAAIELLDLGTAKVTAPGHGISEGEVAVITGCEQAPYNGSHVARHVTPETFEFSVDADLSLTSPAVPAADSQIKVANARDNFTLAARVKLSESGSVTFQRGSGVLWIPSDESTFLWDGFQPFRNRIACDGPVHIFYDGEEKIVTRWASTGVEVIPESVVVSNYTIEETSRIVACQYPGGWAVRTAGGANFRIVTSAHVSGSNGFYGNDFDHTATGESYSSSNAQESVIGSYDVPGGYGNHYGLDPSCYFTDESGNLVTECSSHFASVLTVNRFTSSLEHRSDSRSGSSWCVLFPTEREAVMNISVNSASFSSQVEFGAVTLGVAHYSEDKDDSGVCPATHVESDLLQGHAPEPGSTAPPGVTTSGTTYGGEYRVRASGGFQLSNPLTISDEGEIQNSNLLDFLSWNDNVHKTQAESNSFVMRGGLFYDDPTLTPSNQQGNIFYVIDDATQLAGGFASLEGLVAVAFIGVV